jgi:hypothetical protein
MKIRKNVKKERDKLKLIAKLNLNPFDFVYLFAVKTYFINSILKKCKI